ncbi:sugar ABC transporter permease [Massilia sp. W12]|uniref:carbohydrate ABC transporter permease n=1 Tax=Massilia sp. W12 TaxID=3126507 RepID=UPI0030CE3DF3
MMKIEAGRMPAVSQNQRKVQWQRWQRRAAPWMFLTPFVVLFLCFGVFPILFSLFLSFHSWNPADGWAGMKFVGLENFSFALGDEWFWKSLWNTALLALLSGLPQHLVAIPLAYFLHTSFKRSRNLVVGAYFVPYITSTVAVTLMFTALFSTDFGVINAALLWLAKLPLVGGLFPVEAVDWIGKPAFIQPAVAFIVFWRFVGFNTVLYLAALQTIPKELYEAAEMDGAGKWQQFWHITLPLLRPMMFFGATLSVIGGLQLFDEPFVLTGGRGGADQAVLTTAMYMFRSAFEFGEYGAASAISWLLFVIIALLSWLTHKIFGQHDEAAEKGEQHA